MLSFFLSINNKTENLNIFENHYTKNIGRMNYLKIQS